MDEEAETETKREILDGYQSLVKSQGWGLLRKLVVVRIDQSVGSMVRTRLAGLDDTLAQEYDKGRIAGLEEAMDLAYIMIDTIRGELELEPIEHEHTS